MPRMGTPLKSGGGIQKYRKDLVFCKNRLYIQCMETPLFQVRASRELQERFKAACKEQDLTMSEVVRAFLSEYSQKHLPKPVQNKN